MSQQLNTSERDQLVESAKLFEQIAGTQPDDYQTLETLEETYIKLGQRDAALRAAKRAAQAYARSGLLEKAIAAYESVLLQDPQDAEAAAALDKLKESVKKTEPPPAPERPSPKPGAARDDYELALGRFLVTHGILTQRQLEALMGDLKKIASNATGEVPASSLIDLMQERGLSTADAMLELLCDKYRLPHLPLAFYDVDADIVKLLPRDLCFKYLALPFDRISRTLLVSVANPNVRPRFEALSQKLGLTLQWYLNRPQEIRLVLQNVYRLGASEAKED
jgi:hypothetical protein